MRRIPTTIHYLPTSWFRHSLRFMNELFTEFTEDNCWDKSATIAYYTAFSLAPTLVIILAMADVFFEKQAIRGEIYGQISGVVGEKAAEIIQGLLQNASLSTDVSIGTMISGVTALLGATSVFSVLHASLNQIWQVYHTHDKGMIVMLRQRLVAFVMLLSVGLLLIALIIFNTIMDFMYINFIALFHESPTLLLRLTHSIVSFGFIMILFALVFKILSDVQLRWRDIWAGAALTAGLFTIGRWGISFYLSKSNMSSVYGAAGSLAILLTWIYYSTVILLVGAEFIKIYIRYNGDTIEKKKKAFRVRIAPPR